MCLVSGSFAGQGVEVSRPGSVTFPSEGVNLGAVNEPVDHRRSNGLITSHSPPNGRLEVRIADACSYLLEIS